MSSATGDEAPGGGLTRRWPGLRATRRLQRHWRSVSLLQKLLIPPILMTAVFLTIFGYLYRTGESNIEVMLRELYEFSATARQVHQSGIENLMHVVESILEDRLLELDVEGIGSILASLKKYPAVRSAFVVNADETILGDGNPEVDMAQLGQPLPPDARFDVPLDRSVIESDRDSFIYSHVFLSQGEKIGRLQIQFSLREIATVEAALRNRASIAAERGRGENSQLIVIATAIIVVALAIALFLIHRIGQRLNQLAEAARLVSVGDLDSKVPVTSHDELGALARTFNRMTADLKQSFRTISERTDEAEAARDEALQANKAKSIFLANMSHELRTPLNAIIGYSEMLIEEAEEAEETAQKADLEKIRGAGKHLLGLVSDILDLSKVEAGKMDVFAEDFDVAEMLAEVRTTVEPLVRQNGNRLVVTATADLGRMHSDQVKTRQILFNLLSNAAKFTETGQIALLARRLAGPGGARLEFRVEDTGIGLTADQLPLLFQPFTQANAATTRSHGGTGLGLSITRHFCRMLGGEVSVESEHGKGSAFTATLPACLSATGSTAPAPGPGGTVLVIDDERATHELLERELGGRGYRVLHASGGREGLRLARELRPDLITLDVIMPELDGWAVLRELKADPDLAAIPVVLVTMLGDREMGYALGATDYLTKPVDMAVLLRVLARHIPAERQAEVLVVDDDQQARELARKTLSKAGWAVVEAADGAAALRRLEQSAPAVVLLDLLMPGVDGFEVLEAMRRHDAWRDIPVIVVTAKELDREELDRLNGRAERVFRKGVHDRSELVGIVHGMIGRRLGEGREDSAAVGDAARGRG